MKPFLVDYTDAYILVTGNTTVTGGDDNTKVAFKNCHPFTRSKIHLNYEHVETADNLDLVFDMFNLIEYSDNYSDSTAFCIIIKDKNHFQIMQTFDNSSSLKDKSSLLGNSTAVNANVDPNNPLAHRFGRILKL